MATLPSVIDLARGRWSLDMVGQPFEPGGETAWVAPAHSATFGDVVLKIAFRHYEAFDEAKGLREWDGDGAIRLFAAEDLDETTAVLVLERCRPGSSLSEREGEFQDQVVADLLRRLWREPPFIAPFRPLAQMCDQWADGCERTIASHSSAIDTGLMREGTALFRSLPRDSSRQVLLCTDLHADNVLAAEREPWLVVDPKPYVGDPTYDVLQHILNCQDRLMTNPASLVERMAGLLQLDAERLVLWLFARCVVGAVDWPELLAVAKRLAPT
jgi:streptomycin 6-kinase